MEDLKQIIAGNIVQLRKAAKLTQAELAERLNYSDKAVSKWERGESVPDVAVLKQLAEQFGVSVDYLLTNDHPAFSELSRQFKQHKLRNHGMITAISILLVWLVATFIYVNIDLLNVGEHGQWLAFIYAVPVSSIVWLVFNSIWFNRRRNFFIISLLMWSVLTSFYLSFLVFGYNYWLIFVLGIPGQIIILLWSGIRLLPSMGSTVKAEPQQKADSSGS